MKELKASQLIAAGMVMDLAVLTRAIFVSTATLIRLPILFSGGTRWSRLCSLLGADTRRPTVA